VHAAENEIIADILYGIADIAGVNEPNIIDKLLDSDLLYTLFALPIDMISLRVINNINI
jgi:hypothetical protein